MTNAPSTKMSIEDLIGHYQRSIERSQHDSKRILHCIGKLNRMHVTVQHLQLTKIGMTVNSLRKDNGEVGEAAKALVAKWKDMVNKARSEEENVQDEYRCNEDDQNNDDDDVDDDDDDNDDDDTNNVQIHPVNRSERKSHKTNEHMFKSGSSSSNSSNNHHHSNNNHHRHHHHRDQYAVHEHRSPGKINEAQNHQRKNSSDDTQEHSTHPKQKQKSHSHNDSSKREHEAESNGSAGAEHHRHKISSKHHSKEDRPHRSRHETQNNSDEYSDKKHKSSSKDLSKHSEHHKSHSSSTEKSHTSSKHKRSRELDHTSSSSKKRKSDSISSSSQGDEKKSTKSKFKHADDGIEIDHSMGTSFADALGMLQPTPSHSAKASTSISTSSTSGKSSNKIVSPSTSSLSSSHNKIKVNEKPKASTSSSVTSKTSSTPSLLLKKPKLPPLDDLAKDLPPPSECFISNDYKPSPLNPMILECLYKGTKSQPITMLSETDSLCASTTSKNQRTKVYSGVKSGVLFTVPSLLELCVRFLQKNIDALEYTGGVPFEILRPVLDRASPDQLALFEQFNPYLMDDSDVLWQQHCQRRFKAHKRQEMETWREMFERCKDEQEARLNRLTKNIIQSQSVAIPVRQTKLAYVDSMVKPPRSIIKKQNQFGTHQKPIATPAARVDALSSVASNITRPGDIRLKTTSSMRDTAQAQPSNGAFKPKKAPLMAKTLQLMKGRNMRR